MKKNKAVAQEIRKISILYQDIQGILLSHKISEKCNERDVFYIKSWKTPVLVSLFNKVY